MGTMPRRLVPLITGEYYHLFNRSIHHQPIFTKKRDIITFLDMFTYYAQQYPPIKFSYYKINRDKFSLQYTHRHVTIVAYCVMPSHFHFLVRQEVDDGIRVFLQKTINAYVHHYNLKYEQRGSLFETTFRSVRVETDEQLIHLSRYIHLNPVTNYLVNKPQDYTYSSCSMFLAKNFSLPFDPSIILDNFKNSEDYLTFLLERKDYQRDLEKIKHLIG